MALARLFVIAGFITIVVLGGIHTIYTIKTRRLFGNIIDADLQLAFIGLLNKIMDLLVTKTLENFAGAILTIAMTAPTASSLIKVGKWPQWSGASLEDFELAEELTKPWRSVTAFWKRGRNLGWKRASWTRFLLTLAVSVCVVLQGLAINTVGYPKERWYPDFVMNTYSPVRHPLPHFDNLSWTSYETAAWTLVGAGPLSRQVANAFVVAKVLEVFDQFAERMTTLPYGWHQYDPSRADAIYPALDTRYTAASSRGIAVQNYLSLQVFNHLKTHGNHYAQKAEGWTGHLSVNVPSATVTCAMYRQNSVAGSILVNTIPVNESSSVKFSITVPPVAAKDLDNDSTWAAFSGATCDVTFSRVLFPFLIWIVNNNGNGVLSADYQNSKYDAAPTSSPFLEIDNIIARALALQTQMTIGRFETIAQNYTAARMFLTTARNLRKIRPEYSSDIEALSPVFALLVNQLLTIASWNTTIDDEHDFYTSEPIRWQLYGSGPRLGWEWLSVIILVVLLLAMLASLTFSAINFGYPGEWLKPGGMLVAANTSPTMRSFHDPLKMGDGKEIGKLRFFVRSESAVSNRLFLTDDAQEGEIVNPQDSYRWSL